MRNDPRVIKAYLGEA
ncbi:MAG: hypothetical protein LBV49_08730 [Azonexus sp.]|nr:hypothetical protein [Azonexus sp.]